jgi:hypothetical protein
VEAITAIPWFAWIPISAIVLGFVSGTITTLVKQSQQHRERMAMIRMGIHPDAPQHSAPLPGEKPACYDEV